MMLSVLCITRFEDYTEPFIYHHHALARQLDARLVLAADGTTPEYATSLADPIVHVQSKGYMESVLDEVLKACPDGHVLRLDDDETVSPDLLDWLLTGEWENGDHFAFPRMNLIGDESTYISSPPLWPDLQTRLSTKEKSGKRPVIHQGSPYGTGQVIAAPLLHHKFLIRPEAEREKLVEHYNKVQPGAGDGWLPFSVPERYEFETAMV